jgi:hypothetical protein
VGLVLAAYEDAWSADTWRRPSPADARYLMFLMANGYNPSEVEQLILGAPIYTTGAEPQVDAEEADTDQ